MRTISQALNTALQRTDGASFRWLVDIIPAGGVARHLCADAQVVGGVTYAAELLAIAPMYESISSVGDLTIEVADNAANRAAIVLAADIIVSLWAVGSAAADKSTLFHGEISDPIARTAGKISADAVSFAALDHRMVGVPVSKTEFPGADPDAVGQIKPVIYGIAKGSPCLAVDAGSITTLFADLSLAATTATVTDAAAFPASGTFQCDIEQITYTGKTATTLTGLTRAANGTTASQHDKGALVAEVQIQYDYLVADHPVQSIDAVYVDGVRQSGTDFTFLPNSAGKALVRFHTLPTVVRQVNLVAKDHTTVTDISTLVDGIEVIDNANIGLFSNIIDSGHFHSLSSSGTVTTSPIQAWATGGSVSWVNNIIDGNYATYASMVSLKDVYSQVTRAAVNISHNTPSQPGTAISMSVVVKAKFFNYGPFNDSSLLFIDGTLFNGYLFTAANNYTATLDISISSYTALEPLLVEVLGVVDIYEIKVNSIAWGAASNSLNVKANISISAGGSYIKGVYKGGTGITYTPGISKTGTIDLTGNSVADTKIGGLVTVDVHGYADDASGSITGVANALILRPDHITRHLLINYGGVSPTRATAAEFYAPAGDQMRIIIQSPLALRALIADIAMQSKSTTNYSAGRWTMRQRPSPLGGVVATLTDAETVRMETGASTVVEGVTGLRLLKNRHRWRAGKKPSGNGWDASGTRDDIASQAAYRVREAVLDLAFVPNAAQANVLVAWLSARQANPMRKVIHLQLLFNSYRLEVGDVVRVLNTHAGIDVFGDIISIGPRVLSGRGNGSMTITIEEA